MGRVIAVLLFVTFIRDNPGFIAWFIGGLFTVLGAMAWAWLITNNTRLRGLQTGIAMLSQDLREEINRLSHEEILKLSERISEVEVLLGRSSAFALYQKMADFEIENTKEHGKITAQLGEVRAQVHAIEQNYPTEKLDEALEILKLLMSRGDR